MVNHIRVAVVDNHPLFRAGVASILKAQPNFELIAEGACYEHALKITDEERPDVLLLDIQIPGSGTEAMKQIAVRSRRTKVIMMSASEHEEYVSAVLKAGARGYFLKSEGSQALVRAITAVCNGESYVTPSLAARMFERMNRKNSAPDKSSELTTLTRRETEILYCVGLGLTNKEIAIKFAVSENSAKHCMTNIMNKLQVNNRVKVALIAQKLKPSQSA